MRNADVPLWDKGDKTDDFVRQGSISPIKKRYSSNGDMKVVDDLYALVLSRKPTSNEKAYYKYIEVEPEEIINRLINTQEHADLIAMGRNYPGLEEREKEDQTIIIKLKHKIDDRQNEFEQMQNMLTEKNKEISVLREEKDNPYVKDSFLDKSKGRDIYYGVEKEPDSSSIKPGGWIEKIINFIINIIK